MGASWIRARLPWSLWREGWEREIVVVAIGGDTVGIEVDVEIVTLVVMIGVVDTVVIDMMIGAIGVDTVVEIGMEVLAIGVITAVVVVAVGPEALGTAAHTTAVVVAVPMLVVEGIMMIAEAALPTGGVGVLKPGEEEIMRIEELIAVEANAGLSAVPSVVRNVVLSAVEANAVDVMTTVQIGDTALRGDTAKMVVGRYLNQ